MAERVISPWTQWELLNEVSTTMGHRKTRTPARDHLIRHGAHITDENARRHFRNSIPAEWVTNSFVNDYGKDYHVDMVGAGGRVGRAFYVQLKGTAGCKYVDGGSAVSLALEKKYLAHYLTEATLPVFLVVVDVPAGRGYWVFLQRYLAETLGWDKGGSHTVHIPTANRLEDTALLAAAVDQAVNWMAVFRSPPPGDSIRNRVRELEAMDTRYRVEVTFSEAVEELRLVPTRQVDLRIRIAPKQKHLLAQMHTDLFDLGRPVRFAPGELQIEGSPLVQELAAGVVEAQLVARAQAQVDLTAFEDGHSVASWPGLTGELSGGPKEYYFTARPDRSPFSIVIGPFGGGQPGSIRLTLTPGAWEGQPIRTMSFFDRTHDLFTALVRGRSLAAACEVGGNPHFRVTSRFTQPTELAPAVDFLRLLRKARVVAEHFRVDPLFSLARLDADGVRNVEIAHSVVTGERYEFGRAGAVVTTVLDKAAAAGFTAGEWTAHDLLLGWGETDEFTFLGEAVDIGRIAWEVLGAELATTHEELTRLLNGPEQKVPLKFRASADNQFVLKVLSQEE